MGLVGKIIGRITRNRKIRSEVEELQRVFRQAYGSNDFRRAADAFLEIVETDPRLRYFDCRDYLLAGDAFSYLNRPDEAIRTWITGFHKCYGDKTTHKANLSLLSYNIALISQRLNLLEPAIVFCRLAIEYSPYTEENTTDRDMAKLWKTLVHESKVRGIDVSTIGKSLATMSSEMEGKGKMWFTTINGRVHTQFALWGDAGEDI
jgi:hypothetical protein